MKIYIYLLSPCGLITFTRDDNVLLVRLSNWLKGEKYFEPNFSLNNDNLHLLTKY